ncbi:MAG: carboxy terminal-processing peptidase [Planctomycetales bacterium]|nr:carboxy terminal-processing peptidase [Planctomycetales bacterium]
MKVPCCKLTKISTKRIFAVSALTLFAVGAVFLTTRPSTADLTGPAANERNIALVVSALVERHHLLKHPIDNEISERAMKTFLRSLDPMKVYFYQSDIDSFMKQQDELDEAVVEGNLAFPFEVFATFLKRVDERIEMVDELLAGEFNFSADEEMVTDRDVAVYSTTREEALDRWRKRLKYDLLDLKSEETTGQEAIDRLTRRYHSYANRMHQLKNDDLLEMFLTAVTTGLDPHTTYMSPSSLNDFNIQMRLNLEGIGAALTMEDGYTVVSKIIPGGAADKDGRLKPEDRVVSVGQGDDDASEMIEVIDMNLRDVVKLIRGNAGTVVRLGVKPAGSNDLETYKITRAKVELKESEAQGDIVEDPKLGTKSDGSPAKIGYIKLPSFYMDMEAARKRIPNFKSTTRDVRRILDDFNQKEVDVVVLDLRMNGGGSLTEAINLTGLFIDYGPVVQVKDSDSRVHKYNDRERGVAWDGPLVVMTSKFSASASEILAGAVQDYDRGIIVGDTSTHGKGTVQTLMDVGDQLIGFEQKPNLGALKITMQQFYRPNGDSTQKRGVLSDVVLPSLTDHMDVAESDLDYPVEFDKVPAARLTKYDVRSEKLIESLIAKSEARRLDSEDFKKLGKNIGRYREQKEKKHVTLNEEKFFKEREEFDAKTEDEKVMKEQVGDSDDEQVVLKRDFYVDEVLAITTDYVTALEAR